MGEQPYDVDLVTTLRAYAGDADEHPAHAADLGAAADEIERLGAEVARLAGPIRGRPDRDDATIPGAVSDDVPDDLTEVLEIFGEIKAEEIPGMLRALSRHRLLVANEANACDFAAEELERLGAEVSRLRVEVDRLVADRLGAYAAELARLNAEVGWFATEKASAIREREAALIARDEARAERDRSCADLDKTADDVLAVVEGREPETWAWPLHGLRDALLAAWAERDLARAEWDALIVAADCVVMDNEVSRGAIDRLAALLPPAAGPGGAGEVP
jgi:hypothetical protein